MFKLIITLLTLVFYQQQAQAVESILDAENAIKNGASLESYQRYAGHPLYPYLQYRAYHNNLSSTPSNILIQFLKDNPRAPYSRWLADERYPHWYMQGNIQAILNSYSPTFADESIECYWRLANLDNGNRHVAEANIETLWLSSKSIDPACDPLFAHMRTNGSLSQNLITQRFQLIMQEGSLSLAATLLPYLQGNIALGAEQWINIRQNRLPLNDVLRITDANIRSVALADIIYRNAKTNLDIATHLAFTAIKANIFTHHPKETGRALSRLTAILAQNNDSRAEQIFTAIPKGEHERNAVFDFIAYELRLNRYAELAHLLSNKLNDTEINQTPEYAYWIAKCLEQAGHSSKAKHWYEKAAAHRDIFGFFAAAKLGQPPAINDKPLVKDPSIYAALIAQPATYRLQLFLRIGDLNRARQEYQALTHHMTDEEQRQAALFAAENGWHVQTITTLSKTKDWDALSLRFPLSYQQQITQLANRYGINPASIYAIIRKESIFQPQIKSKAGAVGLMQLMPATAKYTAKQYGIPYSSSTQLTNPNLNLQIGSQYLADQLKQFGHLAYAAAAYNAGPNRVNTWISNNPTLPLDEWIAQIPFYETRDYVKRVLEYERIYEYRLGIKHPLESTIRP